MTKIQNVQLEAKKCTKKCNVGTRFMLRDEEIKERPALKKIKGSMPLGQDPIQLNF